MTEILSAIAARLDITHAALLCVIGALVYLLVTDRRESRDSAKLTAAALDRIAEAFTNFRVDMARRASR